MAAMPFLAELPVGRVDAHFEQLAPPPVVDGHPFTVEPRRSGVTRTRRRGFCGTCEAGGVRICVERPDGDRLVLEEM
jgi:hypothetical protein